MQPSNATNNIRSNCFCTCSIVHRHFVYYNQQIQHVASMDYACMVHLCSDIWDHLEKTAVCYYCQKELAFCGGTTNLRDHLTPLKYTPKAEKNQVSTFKIDTFVGKMICSEGHARKITTLIVQMLVKDLRLAEGFRFK